MAPASVKLSLFEPLVYLRGQSATGEDARGRRRQVDFEAPPAQLRGLLVLTLPRPSRIKEISVELRGTARTDWPEGIGSNRLELGEESVIISQTVSLFHARSSDLLPRRRAQSIGPGISSADVHARGAAAEDGRVAGAFATPTFSSTIEGSSEERAGLARVAQVAARAGSSLLPQALIRELQGDMPHGSSGASLSSGRRSGTSTPKRPSMRRAGSAGSGGPVSGSSLTTASSHASSSFSPSARGVPSPQSSALSAAPLRPHSPLVSPPLSAQGEPPPSYTPNAPPRTASPSPLRPTLPIAAPTSPQSNHAAGPQSRSILHPAGRQERNASSPSTERGAVRFGQGPPPGAATPEAETAAPAFPSASMQRSGSLQSQRWGNATSAPSTPSVNHTFNPFAAESSTSTSRRRSTDRSMEPAANAPLPAATKPKAKKGGIKSLLGGLLKEADKHRDDERETRERDKDEEGGVWREFAKGTYTYPISFPLPAALPPTLHADFGSNVYQLRGLVVRSGALTPNLAAETEVVLVHAPDEDGREETESIVVERTWEDSLAYAVVISGKSFPVGATIPLWLRLVPIDKCRVHRVVATLEERTDYFAKGRRIARHEVPRRWTLLKLMSPVAGEPLLPITSESPDALSIHPLTPYAQAAALSYAEADRHEGLGNPASLLDPLGPWEMAAELQVPMGTRINISTNHARSNIAVRHIVRLSIRVEKVGAGRTTGPDGKPQLFDINIECPLALTHSQTAHAWLSLPDYWSLPAARDDELTVVTAPDGALPPDLAGTQRASVAVGAETAPRSSPQQRVPLPTVRKMSNGPSSPATSVPLSAARHAELRSARRGVNNVTAATRDAGPAAASGSTLPAAARSPPQAGSPQAVGRAWLTLSTAPESPDGTTARIAVPRGSEALPNAPGAREAEELPPSYPWATAEADRTASIA